MPHPLPIRFAATDETPLARLEGRLAVIVPPGSGEGGKALPRGVLGRLDRLTRGAMARLLASEAWGKVKPGEAMEMAFPAGLAAEALHLIRLDPRAETGLLRKAGGAIGARLGKSGVSVLLPAAPPRLAAEISMGLALRAYDFTAHKSAPGEGPGPVSILTPNPEAAAAAAAPLAALAEGVCFARDLVNEPANVLTTLDFAARLAAMQEIGLEVEILEVEELERLGMRALLGVAQGSESPARVVVMQWKGGKADAPPLALVGKGVVFDTGGISIKPAGGMEEMTMDMGGGAVVSGVMRTLALRRAKANVVGLVGLVENMPDGRAQRPGDIVRSMKGDTIEIINTDAEGRLVLADVLWYVQERFKPSGIIDLATLTGAIIVALGSENAGLFANDEALAEAILAAARAEGEGAWRMPMGEGYDAKLKSRLADMMNVGGRDGGAVTAAQFLARFVAPGTPWAHLDIAGVTLAKADLPLSPKGATGWGVMTLNRLVAERHEKG
ncbi:MAG TPA: leucyl aminopeptidase [Paracoccaceae bacterium]|nr:leucyl aminopeptidase [Paracoccaceae bacterium]HMO70758.1 leucyl aminopeptidase [Paracoccaceae bacterium]